MAGRGCGDELRGGVYGWPAVRVRRHGEDRWNGCPRLSGDARRAASETCCRGARSRRLTKPWRCSNRGGCGFKPKDRWREIKSSLNRLLLRRATAMQFQRNRTLWVATENGIDAYRTGQGLGRSGSIQLLICGIRCTRSWSARMANRDRFGRRRRRQRLGQQRRRVWWDGRRWERVGAKQGLTEEKIKRIAVRRGVGTARRPS